jgi:hypothetical protein
MRDYFIAISSDGSILASPSTGKSVILWRAATLVEVEQHPHVANFSVTKLFDPKRTAILMRLSYTKNLSENSSFLGRH